MADTNAFWPDGARLAVSMSLMFEGGGQPISGAGGVIPEPIEKGVPDLPTNAFFAYGHYEGVPRVLDLMDKHRIKLSSFMIGKAVETSPDLAREIVRRGHEAAAHGRVWDNSYQLPREQEKRFIADSVETIEKVTGQRPVGWNTYWMRSSIHILETLQELRSLGSAIKEHTLTHLDEYLDQFEANARSNGIHVHWAGDAAEHNQIVHGVLRDHGAKSASTRSSIREEWLATASPEADGKNGREGGHDVGRG